MERALFAAGFIKHWEYVKHCFTPRSPKAVEEVHTIKMLVHVSSCTSHGQVDGMREGVFFVGKKARGLSPNQLAGILCLGWK